MHVTKDAKFCCGEVIPKDRLFADQEICLIEALAKCAARIGYRIDKYDHAELILSLESASRLEMCASSKLMPEASWILCHFADKLWVRIGKENIFFGILSSHSAEITSPFGQTARQICQQVGIKNCFPALCREILAIALTKGKQMAYADLLSVKSSFPPESQLTTDILVASDALDRDMTLKVSPDYTIRPFRIIDSKVFDSGNLIQLLQSTTPPKHMSIAQCRPMLFSEGIPSSASVLDVIHHYGVACSSGRLEQLVDELLSIAISFQWKYASDRSPLPETQAEHNAFEQLNRMRTMQETLSRVSNGLQLLQKRFPSNKELVELEINNQYAAICRYSPGYRRLREDLRRYVDTPRQEDKPIYPEPLLNLDWKVLRENGIANAEEASTLVKLINVDPASTLTKMRVLVEKIVTIFYQKTINGKDRKLSAKLYALNEKGVFPSLTYVYLNTLRLAGNLGAHGDEGTKEEVQALLPVFICVVEWFVDQQSKEKTTK